MELDELKNTWMVLDEQLKKNEMLNRRIVREMLYKKSNKSLNWLISYDVLGIPVLLLVIPFCVWLYNLPRTGNMLFPKILFIFTIIVSILGIIWYCYKLKQLMKMDFSKSVKDNMLCLNKYNFMITKEKSIQYFVLAPIISLLCIFSYYELKANVSWRVFLVVMLILAIAGTYWMYKKIYDKNIQSIKKSLEELEELKD